MARNDQASRILRIIHILEKSTEGLRVAEILERLKDAGYPCTRRTIYRDLEAIQAGGLPLENSDSGEANGLWKLSQVKAFDSRIVVNYEELLSLFLARETLRVYEGTALFDSLNIFFDKFEKILGSKASATLQEFCFSIGVQVKSQWAAQVSRSVLDTVHQACADGEAICIQYKAASGDGAGKVVERRVGPECLYFADSGAYLVAKDLEKDEFRVFAMARIHGVELLNEAYESSIVSPESFFSESFGLLRGGQSVEVIIDVDRPLAHYVAERSWHKSQQIEETPYGIRLKMKVKVSSELVGWILSLGAAAEVIAPKSLREEILNNLDRIKSKYSDKKAA